MYIIIIIKETETQRDTDPDKETETQTKTQRHRQRHRETQTENDSRERRLFYRLITETYIQSEVCMISKCLQRSFSMPSLSSILLHGLTFPFLSRQKPSLDSFRSNLKTFLFSELTTDYIATCRALRSALLSPSVSSP